MSSLTFDQKVVIITNAHTAIAQSYASFFAARGALVVLNYPPHLTAERPFDKPENLSFTKGKETSSTNSLLETREKLWNADKIVSAAVKKYGTVHILVYNSLVERSGGSGSIWSSETWKSLQDNVVKGAFKATKAVWPYFRKNSYGRIVFTSPDTKGSGIATQAGRFALFGFAQTLAREGAKYNIRVNTVSQEAPCYVTAKPSPAIANPSPEALVSLVGYLSHDSHIDGLGSLYEIADNRVSRLRWERAKGIFLNPDVNFTNGVLATRWHSIDDFSEKVFSTSAMDFGNLLPQMQDLPPNIESPSPGFHGRVALVTGGGSGLGRCYAIAFAKLGASVIVNDRADPRGVVEEIQSFGGQATAIIDSVENGGRIVEKALSTYGHIDILVNNAGFVRDKSFTNMDEDTWDTILNVHLNGTYEMTKAVWPQFLRQGHGSVVNTTSTSGIYGNFGQSNYSTAKLGILGLSEATAREGSKHNIRVNTIAPVASTGGLAQALSGTNDKNKQPVFKPEYIVPIVLLLTSEVLNGKKNDVTGGLFECGCGWHARTRLRPSHTFRFDSPSDISLEEIAKTLTGNTQNSPGKEATIAGDSHTHVLKLIEKRNLTDTWRTDYNFSDRDVILYNLSVGAKRHELQFVYEGSKSFQPVPTFGVIPFFSLDVIYHHQEILPNFKADQSLLGEVYLETFRDRLPTSGSLTSTRNLIDVLDKGNAAVGITGYTTSDAATGAKLFYTEISFFMRGAGGFGGPRERSFRGPASRSYTMPIRAPDSIDEFRTSEEQAALYRLTGDRMPMHIDPEFSRHGGFPVPILHGMCFMGIAGKHLFQRYGAYKSIKVKLAGVVVPGQTLRTESWRDDEEKNLVVFQMRVVETGSLCIAGGGIHLRDVSNTSLHTSRL